MDVAKQTDFYVKPNGEAVPATGYRYMSSEAGYLDDLSESMSIPANVNDTYFSFDNYSTPQPGMLQVPHDAAVKGTFDTLQIIDDVRIPYGEWGNASWLEPLTKDYSVFGPGGATQAITNQKIMLDNLIWLSK